MLKQNSESFDVYNECANDIKKKILREGIWEPYTQRIKNLEKSQEKLWKLYYSVCDIDCKRKILEDIVNLQPVIADWYSSSKKVIEIERNCGVANR